MPTTCCSPGAYKKRDLTRGTLDCTRCVPLLRLYLTPNRFLCKRDVRTGVAKGGEH
jgi:hypothetical protein